MSVSLRIVRNDNFAGTIPGIGPVIASTIVATIGDPGRFRSGRDFAVWLVLVLGATAMLRRKTSG